MTHRARARSSLPALISVVLLAGCSTHIYQDFIYAPHRFQQAMHTQLKIAIIPFEDLRETRASGNLGWASVPIVPYASRTEDRRQVPDERFRSDYYLPDLLAHVIAVELAFNQVSSRIDLAPLALDDYDLIPLHYQRRDRLLEPLLAKLRFSQRNLTVRSVCFGPSLQSM